MASSSSSTHFEACRSAIPSASARPRQAPRGLGVAVGLSVDDLDATFAYCTEAGCEITCEPMEEAWGDRVFECIDPYGYQWEFSQPIEGASATHGLEAVRTSWFGTEE
jgi:uncharacterized glyoxalase superfamily protein PhnB